MAERSSVLPSAVHAMSGVVFGSLLLYVLIPPQDMPGPAISSSHYAVTSARLVAPRMSSMTPSVHAAAAELAGSFVQSHRDATTDRYLSACIVTSLKGRVDVSIRSKLYAFLQLLGWSHTDANAFSSRYSLFVASQAQLAALLQRVSSGAMPRTLFDIGSGTGSATAVVASALRLSASHVTVVEDSAPLRHRLAMRGYRALASLDEAAGSKYDAVSLLNVLDRCDDPRALLRGAMGMLSPGGLILLESVLPYCPRVYKGAWGAFEAHRPPRSPLNLSTAFRCHGNKRGLGPKSFSFEVVAAGFVAAAVDGFNLEVVSWTRLPYLGSGGGVSHVVLDAALFVLRARPASPVPRKGAARRWKR